MSKYSVEAYGRMIRDDLRMTAYHEALQQAIQPGDVVIDIGTGTGIHALLACQLGASKVYAIEPAKAIEVAKETAKANGYSDRIQFIQDISTNLIFPEKADVIISDLHGVMPWYHQHIPSLIDARQRLLKPSGCLLPEEDRLWGGIVQADELYNSYVQPWNETHYGFNLQAGIKVMTNSWGRGRAEKDQFLTASRHWHTLNYHTVSDPNLNATLSWEVEKAGTGHGMMLWFDTTVIPGVTLTSAPYEPEIAYGSAFFPWSEPVSLEKGDRIEVQLRADLTGQSYTWSWQTVIYSADTTNQKKKHFQQSTFYSQLLSLSKLKKRASTYQPKLSAEGKIDREILHQMDGRNTLEAIASTVQAHFPEKFSNHQQALQHVQELSEIYG